MERPYDPIDLAADLVRLPSVNPMGAHLDPSTQGEWRVTEFIRGIFDDLGLWHASEQIAPHRENVVGVLQGRGAPADCVLVIQAHQDTVPTDNMTIPPFDPQIRNGRLYGRGACDDKGSIAAALAAIASLRLAAAHPTVVLAFTVGEEDSAEGSNRMASALAAKLNGTLPRVPEACVVMEPTGLRVVVAHKGSAKWKIRTVGTSGHGAYPERGHNAIYDMIRVVDVLRARAERLASTPGLPLLGTATLNVGTIHGGTSANTIPGSCEVEVDLRVLPSESPRDARLSVIRLLDEELGAQVQLLHDEPTLLGLPLDGGANGTLAERLRAALADQGVESELTGVAYGTDAPAFAAIGCPTVVFGPGSIQQAHGPEEWIEVAQLNSAARALAAMLVNWSGEAAGPNDGESSRC